MALSSKKDILEPEVADLRSCLLQALGRDPLSSTDPLIRWDRGLHASFPPSSSLRNIDHIKIYHPELSEKVRRSYGVTREMLLQELDFGGAFFQVPVGEFPDLLNVRSHFSLMRSRSSSIKHIFGISGNAEAGSDDDPGTPRGGSSPSGVILRRNGSINSKGGDSPSGEASPGGTLQRKTIFRQSVNRNSESGNSNFESTEIPNGGNSFKSRLSPSLSAASNNIRTTIKFTSSYLTFRKRVLIESVSPEYFHELTHTFDSRAAYLQDSPKSLLPKIVTMLRLSSTSPAKGAPKLKAYFVLSILPYPTENHEHMYSLCLKGEGTEHGARIDRGPFSGLLFLSDGDFAREHEVVTSTYARAQLVAQLASDFGHLQHHGVHFAIVVVATMRDPVLGRPYTAGGPLGPELDDLEPPLSLDRRNTLRARHDLPLGVLSCANALLPAPPCCNWERPLWEYYIGIHEFTSKVSSSSWRDWFSGKVGAHEYTSRLLSFLKEKVFIDGGDLKPNPPTESTAENESQGANYQDDEK